MAKEASSANPSVPLHELLEAEFAVLHGKLPSDCPSSSDPNIRLTAISRMLGAYTMEKLCEVGGGDFSAFHW
jgi:hypothetical protein